MFQHLVYGKACVKRILHHALKVVPSIGVLAMVGAVLVFFLPPVSKINVPETKHLEPKPATPKIIRQPSPQKTPASQSSTATSAVAPAPTPKTTTASSTPPVVKPAPSSSVSNLQTSAPSTPTSSPPATSSPSGSGGSVSPPANSYSSSNWAGYFAANGTYSAVSANWTAPTPTGGSAGSADATWIGIGGITASDLIQVGTDNLVSASGRVSSAAFYEMLPAAATTITSLIISPGDAISAALNQVSGGIWTISITDDTTNQNFTTTVSYNSSLSSVEWIEEDPMDQSGNLYPLDDFGNVAFSNCLSGVSGSSQTLAAIEADSVTMINSSNQPEAVPSAIGNDGASFNVTWQ